MGEVQHWTAQPHRCHKRGNKQGECPKITVSNLVLSKSVRRLLALLVVCDFLMNADRNGTWAQSEHVVDCARNFSRGIYNTIWVMVGIGAAKGLHSKDTYVTWWGHTQPSCASRVMVLLATRLRSRSSYVFFETTVGL